MKKEEPRKSQTHSLLLFRLLASHFISNTINTPHTITSPNITIPAAPIVPTTHTVSTVNKINVINKIVINIIINTLLSFIIDIEIFANKKK